MIHDTLTHATLYEPLGPRLAAAFRFLRQNDLQALPLGRLEIEGKALFAIIDEYESKPLEKCFWEAHRKYIDVQYLVRGLERMGHAELGGLRVSQPYQEEKDLLKLEDPAGLGQFLTVRAGTFVIFHPHDAHLPGLAADRPVPVRKIVLKVAVD